MQHKLINAMNVKILKKSGGYQCLCEEFMATGPSGSVTEKSTSYRPHTKFGTR